VLVAGGAGGWFTVALLRLRANRGSRPVLFASSASYPASTAGFVLLLLFWVTGPGAS
jgi:hypothetical protein